MPEPLASLSWTIYSHTDYEPPWRVAEVATEEEAQALADVFRAGRESGDGSDFDVMSSADFDDWTEHDYDSYP